MNNRWTLAFPLAVLVIGLRGAVADTPRQEQVERNSVRVMPFDMSATMHHVHVLYGDLPNGAEITYATHDAALVAAIHQWFTAQVADHASHATMKM